MGRLQRQSAVNVEKGIRALQRLRHARSPQSDGGVLITPAESGVIELYMMDWLRKSDEVDTIQAVNEQNGRRGLAGGLNRPLEQRVREGQDRQRLFYRGQSEGSRVRGESRESE